MQDLVYHFWMCSFEMQPPFCCKPNGPIVDVCEQLHLQYHCGKAL